MSIDHSGTGVKTGIRNPHHPDFTVVIGNILDQPFDGIPGIRAFIEIRRILFFGEMRPHVDKIAFRHPSAANVLIDEDVARFSKQRRWAQVLTILVNPVWFNAVGGTGQHHWIGLRRILRHVHGGKQPFAITHRNSIFVLRIVGFHMLKTLSGSCRREVLQRAPFQRDLLPRHDLVPRVLSLRKTT